MLLFGLAQALSMGVGAPTIARYFGRAHHGAIRAAATVLGVAGTGLGPVALGLSLDLTGDFSAGLLAFVAVCAPLALFGTALRRPDASRGPGD